VPNIPYAQKLFWTHPIELLGDVGHDESCFGPSLGPRHLGVPSVACKMIFEPMVCLVQIVHLS
jgi:hypothetical protein